MPKKFKQKSRKGVSLMVSYVLLISIAIAISAGVFIWLRTLSNINPPADCKEDTSVILDRYVCYNGAGSQDAGISLEIKNNGRFNVTGIILAVSNDTQKAPATYLIPDIMLGEDYSLGHYSWQDPLKPGEQKWVKFTNKTEIDGIEKGIDFQYIRVVQIQPFITYGKEKIVCQTSVIEQNIENCAIE